MNEHDEAYTGELQRAADEIGLRSAPKGSSLARARIEAHKALDVLWRFDLMTRDEAYRRLARAMNLPTPACHIGYFDEVQCRLVVKLVEAGDLHKS